LLYETATAGKPARSCFSLYNSFDQPSSSLVFLARLLLVSLSLAWLWLMWVWVAFLFASLSLTGLFLAVKVLAVGFG